MFEEIIKNPIETPRGYKNTVTGIVLRGPLSQFFSAIYLKPLDDTFDHMDVTYIRYQDDLIVLCKTKRQSRTIRKAREQVKAMVATGFLPKKIMAYLKNWALWWVKTTAKTWDYQVLLSQFIES